MKRSVYSRTDTTKRAIRQAEKVIKEMKEANPQMTWRERNEAMNKIAEQYKGDEMFQPIFFGDSIYKWWNKNWR